MSPTAPSTTAAVTAHAEPARTTPLLMNLDIFNPPAVKRPTPAVLLSDGSWANLDLDFVRNREWRHDVAGSFNSASESGANVDPRELCDAYDSSAPAPVTPDERRSSRR